MTELPAAAREIVDQEHLKILSIVHYIFGSLQALLSCILIVHFVLGLVMATVPQALGHGQPPPVWFGLAMSALSGCFMLVGWLFGGLTIYSGYCIRRRRARGFSLIMAAINCLSIPFGTALGICTIVVLTRPSVRQLYA